MSDKNKPKNATVKSAGIFDKFKNMISGLVSNKSEDKVSVKPTVKPMVKKEETKVKKPETVTAKTETVTAKTETVTAKTEPIVAKAEPIAIKTQAPKTESTDSDDTASKLKEKFKEKKAFEKRKSFSEIAAEAEEKIKDKEGKAFTESDDVINEQKRVEAGFESHVKKKTMKALEGKVFLVRGKDNGRPAWHYVVVPHEKIKELRQQKSGTNIDVADYGKIVKSGWGLDPSPEIIKEVEEKYGD